MPPATHPVLDLSVDTQPDPDEFIAAAMNWHFSEATGSPYWLERARSLDFNPLTDVTSHDDLALFPNVADELREVAVRDLIPRGYGEDPPIVGVFESGGTTGPPKRVICLGDWFDRLLAWSDARLDAFGFPRGVNWLVLTPTGPHIVGALSAGSAALRGGLRFSVDLDPRWVRSLIANGRTDEADAYAEHVVDQAATVLRSQDIGVLTITPPLLERLASRDHLLDLVNEKVRAIRWGGTQMDADSRYLYQAELFPNVTFYGHYGSTMILGIASQRPGLDDEDRCVFDPFSPYITFSVVHPATGDKVAHGERGQVVMSHVSRAFLLPNNVERDLATRMRPAAGQLGDSVADVAPLTHVDRREVIEGVY